MGIGFAVGRMRPHLAGSDCNKRLVCQSQIAKDYHPVGNRYLTPGAILGCLPE
jgi:hypothetical protein